ncbi:MAG: HAD-IA family hydrolase [Burkholderiaceae bacterium]|jgi:phosphoglycolate phosphatase|nr:HAD-IA family hydrolase [Burkholderiaceae bacterium]
MAPSPIQAVLFDLDGTLIDSAPDLGAAADAMRIARGLSSLPLETYRPLAGSGARGMLNIAFGIEPDHPDFPALREEFFRNYEQAMLLRSHIFEGVSEMLCTLQARAMRWGVVTNKIARFALPLTDSLPLFKTAGTIVCGDTTPHTKPHPQPLLEAARRLNVAPEHCVYVGDDERDMIAGHAAGMRTVAACYGYLGIQPDVTRWSAGATIAAPHDFIGWLNTQTA